MYKLYQLVLEPQPLISGPATVLTALTSHRHVFHFDGTLDVMSKLNRICQRVTDHIYIYI